MSNKTENSSKTSEYQLLNQIWMIHTQPWKGLSGNYQAMLLANAKMKFITLDEEIFLNLRMAANDMKLEAERWQIHR